MKMKKSFIRVSFIILKSLSLFFTTLSFLLIHDYLNTWISLQLAPSIVKLVNAFTFTTLFILLTILLSTFLFGRFYCSFLCPLGILQDFLLVFSPRKKKSIKKPHYKRLGYAIFFISFPLLLLGESALIFSYLDPFSFFGKICTSFLAPLLGKVLNVAFASLYLETPSLNVSFIIFFSLLPLLLLFFLLLLKKRVFCTSFCPVGTLLRLISKVSFYKMKINNDQCISCQKCVKSCPASCIEVTKEKSIQNDLCLRCMKCRSLCPKDAIRFSKEKKEIKKETLSEVNLSKRNFLLGSALTCSSFFLGIFGRPHKILAKSQIRDPSFIVPPGAGSKERFLSLCTSCGLCISTCQGGVLQKARQHGPVHLDFSKGFCEYDCMNCLKVCPSDAITSSSLEEKKRTRIGLAALTLDLCITKVDKTDCGACAEQCPTGALQMRDLNGLRLPILNEALCIGCGACENACPVIPKKAIVVNAVPIQVQVQDAREYFKKNNEDTKSSNQKSQDTSESSGEWAF